MTEVRYDKIKAGKESRNDGNSQLDPLPPLLLPDGAVAPKIFERRRVTRRERLAVECLKPRFRAPCSQFQKLKCVWKRGTWRLKRCHSEDDIDEDSDEEAEPECHCQKGAEFGWRKQLGTAASLLDESLRHERRKQRNFLLKHATLGEREEDKLKMLKKQHRFLKSLSSHHRRRGRGGKNHHYFRRFKRDHNADDELAPAEEPVDEESKEVVVVESAAPVEEILDDIAEEEIDEVDVIMEDITEEIKDLQVRKLQRAL